MTIFANMEIKVLDPRIYEIAKKIKQLRIEARYTSYEAFAKANGFDRMQYGRLERGTNFTIETFLGFWMHTN